MNNLIEETWRIVEKVVEARGRKLQKYSFFEKVWKSLYENKSLTIIRAPTGCGKTEASTIPFIKTLAEARRRWLSLIYALPTRSLAFSMRGRLASYLKVIGVDWATTILDYGTLFEIKPYLEGDIAVTTYDTLVYEFYGIVRPKFYILLPFAKISSSLIVLDEVQLLQDEFWYAMSLVPYHISALVSAGAQVILMSATLPSALLEEIDKVAGKYGIEDIVATDSPLRGEIRQLILKDGSLPESGIELLEIIRECAQTYHVEEFPVLIIVNKVEKAVRVYENLLKSVREMKLDVDVILLHSRLRQGYRRLIEERIERLQKHARNSKAILVATQVVEAGLDFDVSILLTEISPIDSLIQRIGRCARKRDGCVVVFMDKEAGKGVYLKEPMDITESEIRGRENELKRTIKDVKAAQDLVDSVYREEVIEEIRNRANKLGLELSHVQSWAQNFVKRIFSRTAHEVKVPLLRVGREYLCWTPIKSRPLSVDYETYIDLVNGRSVTINLEDFRSNLVKLSIRITSKGFKIPPAIIHEKRDGVKIVVLLTSLVQNSSDSTLVTLSPKILTLDRLSPRTNRNKEIFLLNPQYYRLLSLDEKSLIELGVVKLFK